MNSFIESPSQVYICIQLKVERVTDFPIDKIFFV